MQIIVVGNDIQVEELKFKTVNTDIEINFIQQLSELNYDSADAIFLLNEEINSTNVHVFEGKAVFINSVIQTLKQQNLPDNFIRINGWPTFLKREVWEVATANEAVVKEIFRKLNWNFILVADEPGFVSARIISMIINEAYFALGDGVSTRDEIDLAMKLGTNYPYGPFEWCNKIGLKKIYSLLEKLSISDSRYNIAPAMKKEFSQI
jgi:3-hydroxybutyryl-CoA dehydrogenase